MPKRELDSIDRKILFVLQENAAIPNVTWREESACRRHHAYVALISSKKRRNRRRVTLVEPAAVGLGVSVFVQVTLEKQAANALRVFEKTVLQRPEVMECYLMTGDADYLLRVVVPDITAFEKFVLDQLTRIASVARVRSSFALKQVKYTTTLPI